MTESQVVRRLVTRLKALLPGAVIFKHADSVTAGIPDVSVTCNGRAMWLEVKYLRDHMTPSKVRKFFDRRQLVQCLRLNSACRYAVAYYLDNELYLAVLPPDYVRLILEGPSEGLEGFPRFSPFSGRFDRMVELLSLKLGGGL